MPVTHEGVLLLGASSVGIIMLRHNTEQTVAPESRSFAPSL
jgi:hypothetical protein